MFRNAVKIFVLSLVIGLVAIGCGNEIDITPSSEILQAPEAGSYTGKIAFNSDRDSNREIYVMDSDGSNRTRLTTDPGDDLSPAWLPDGKYIVWASNRSGDYEIWRMNTDGTDKTNITNNPDMFELAPDCFPDGSKIAYAASVIPDTHSTYEIYVMNADGSNQTQLTNNSVVEAYPAVSPDGTKIAFQSARHDPGGNISMSDIYVMNSDGSNVVRLTTNRSWHPTWSPDGTKIAFVSRRGGNEEIYVMNADGTNQTQLTSNSGSNIDPAWSPDGKYVAFASNYEGNYEIYVMNADGTNQTRLTFDGSAENRFPAWSPYITEEEAGFVTGGGWIPLGKKKANFGFNVKSSGDSTTGHLTYIDHSTKMKVKSETMSSLVITDNKATFTGDCKIDGVGGYTFTVEVEDNGEPGKNDIFNISLSDGYSAGGTLGGGNIQIHSE